MICKYCRVSNHLITTENIINNYDSYGFFELKVYTTNIEKEKENYQWIAEMGYEIQNKDKPRSHQD